MSTSTDLGSLRIVTGDLLQTQQQAVVNTVNTVGVMGKGIALAFKQRYPAMFADYVARCSRGDVALGRPYVFAARDHLIVNFPTKGHWRAVSKLADIVDGLEHLERNYRAWGITSIAVPPLGCGNGQLDWVDVGPVLVRHLSRLDIPVELYAPAGVETDPVRLLTSPEGADPGRIPPEWVAIVAVLDRLQRQKYHWPVGRTMFQKLVYFATEAGIATGLTFERGSYGPFNADLTRRIAQLQSAGLAVESEHGAMLEVRVGPEYGAAVARVRAQMEPYRKAVEQTVDLMARMDTTASEVAATVHFVAAEAQREQNAPPSMSTVLERVEAWKPGRFSTPTVVDAAALLCMRGWSRIDVDDAAEAIVEERLRV